MRMDICLAADNNFAKYMGTTIASILKNAKESDDIVFHLMDGKISESNKNKILDLKNIKNCDIKFYTPDINLAEKLFEKNEDRKHFTSATMYRLFIPELIKDVDKILYLDSDIIVVDSLEELFDINFQDKFALVVDSGVINRNVSVNYLKEEVKYNNFNAGVMMINNKLWRETNIIESFNDFCSKAVKLEWGDEEILNNVLKDRVKWIHRKYNFSAHKAHSHAINDINEEIVFIHYLGELKPWSNDISDKLFVDEFWKYHVLTPWFRENPTDTIRIMIEQAINSSSERINKIDKRSEKLVNALVWIIPVKKWRDKIRSYFCL